jgi:hypothetical protein
LLETLFSRFVSVARHLTELYNDLANYVTATKSLFYVYNEVKLDIHVIRPTNVVFCLHCRTNLYDQSTSSSCIKLNATK